MTTGGKRGGSSAVEQGIQFPEALESTISAARIRLETKLLREREMIARHETQAKSLDSRLKTLDAGLAIANGSQPLAVSLLYKKVGSGAYIKGRCWWDGKQREVQIGTIPAVLKSIGAQKEIPALTTWDEIKASKKLTGSIKALGREKLRAYIIRQLLTQYLPNYNPPIESKTDSGSAMRKSTAKPTSSTLPSGVADWYSQWHQENMQVVSII